MQSVGTSVSLTARIGDHDDVCRVAHLYMDGAAKGDAGKLKEAFGEHASRYG